MKLKKTEITLNEVKMIDENYKYEELELKKIIIVGRGIFFIDKRNIIYKENIFLAGKPEIIRADIDDYVVLSDKYIFVYNPMLKVNMKNKDLKNRIDNFWKRIDSQAKDLEALRELEALIDEVDRDDCVDLVYLDSKGIEYVTIDELKWKLIPLTGDIVTGMQTYTFTGYYLADDKIKTAPLKMPYKLWKRVARYFNLYVEPSDNFDPMSDVKRGTHYIWANDKDKVEKIFKEYNKEVE
jgi:hypothetical protein